MESPQERAHGVTPGLSRDYENRTVEQQAAFMLPYLHSGMNLLDVGCGPGSITLGLAKAVSPGRVTGIDHDSVHVEAAEKLAEDQGITNVAFQTGNALTLPFEEGTFDAAFENNVFVHLSEDAGNAAKEIYRVLRPGGFFAARDVDTKAVVWGNLNDSIKHLDTLFSAWFMALEYGDYPMANHGISFKEQHRRLKQTRLTAWLESRGSDVTLGKHLPTILREAGFTNTIKSVSADTKGTPEAVRSHAEITLSLLDGPFGRDIVDKGWADMSTVEQLKDSIRAWGEHPDAFFANVHVEVIGWKPVS